MKNLSVTGNGTYSRAHHSYTKQLGLICSLLNQILSNNEVLVRHVYSSLTF